jgi:hypothetical protein
VAGRRTLPSLFRGVSKRGDRPLVRVIECPLARAGRLRAITSHGELDLPDGCTVRIVPGPTIHTYGLDMSLRALAKNPLDAAGTVTRPT